MTYQKSEATNTISSSNYVHPSSSIHPTAYLAPHSNISISSGAVIGAYSHIGSNTNIGQDTVIEEYVSVKDSIIGKRCHIKSGARIGGEAFSFVVEQLQSAIYDESVATFDNTSNAQECIIPIKVINTGGVVVENDVSIGNNTCIDRGIIGYTIIKSYTKIDNLIQIAHDVEIGYSCMIASQTGIAGASVIGNRVIIGGQAGISGHLFIGDGALIAAKSGVTKDVPSLMTVGGYPARKITEWHRANASIFRDNNKPDIFT